MAIMENCITERRLAKPRRPKRRYFLRSEFISGALVSAARKAACGAGQHRVPVGPG
jgi:hypothetical protein